MSAYGVNLESPFEGDEVECKQGFRDMVDAGIQVFVREVGQYVSICDNEGKDVEVTHNGHCCWRA